MTATDLVLSSGFLAFARHCGFLSAVEEAGLEVDGVCGTSSGALTGALWAAGWPAERIAAELSATTPWGWMRLSGSPWRGVFHLEAAIAQLRTWLPERIEDLPRPFAVGVAALDGGHALITEGPLPEAVMASCAMPGVFRRVEVNGQSWADGGAVDRIGAQAWRSLRGRPCLVHVVERSHGPPTEAGLEGCTVVRSPRSGARFWSLGDFDGQLEESRGLAREQLAQGS